MSFSTYDIVIIGAGVIGLTTALSIQEKFKGESGPKYSVSIIAEVFPTDPKTIQYTSHWAGAHHVTHAHDPQSQAIDQETFQKMWELSEPGTPSEHCFMRLPQTEYYNHTLSDEELAKHHLNWYPDFKPIPSTDLPSHIGALAGVSFTTVTIDTPVYLNYLLSTFLAQGGKLVRGAVQHISQVVEGGTDAFDSRQFSVAKQPDAIIVCTGIGSRFLGGIEDSDVFPQRGQTVIIRAPWIKEGKTISDANDTSWTYIIPRRSGDVILGGVRDSNDWFHLPRPETKDDILQRTFALFPELAPPEIRAKKTATIDDLKEIIIGEGCGLRPARSGGVRVDLRWFEGGGKKVPVISHYGHAGSGYQSSWGSASRAVTLLEDTLGLKS